MTSERKIFIACPLRNKNAEVMQDNIERAEHHCRQCYEAGAIPLCPVVYLPHFLKPGVKEEDEFSEKVSDWWIGKADEVWVFDKARGITAGMRAEIEMADKYGIPVKYETKEEI